MRTLISAKSRGRCIDYDVADICCSFFFIIFMLFLNLKLILMVCNIWDKHRNFYAMVACNILNMNFMYMHFYMNNCLKVLHERTFWASYELLAWYMLWIVKNTDNCSHANWLRLQEFLFDLNLMLIIPFLYVLSQIKQKRENVNVILLA
jgi:hypothetical protein